MGNKMLYQRRIRPPKNPFKKLCEAFEEVKQNAEKLVDKGEKQLNDNIKKVKEKVDQGCKNTIAVGDALKGTLEGRPKEEIKENFSQILAAPNATESMKLAVSHHLNRRDYTQKKNCVVEKPIVSNNMETELTADKMLRIISEQNTGLYNDSFNDFYNDFARLTNVDLANIGISVNEFEQMNTLIDYGYYKEVKNVMLGLDASPEAIFEAVYNSPTLITKGVLALSKELRTSYSSSLEDILRYYMEHANDVTNVTNLIKGLGFSAKAGCYSYDLMVKSYQYISEFKDSYGSQINIINLRPVFLAALWAAMIFDLSAHDSLDVDEKGIVKFAMSLVLISIVGATGYMHSGGRVFGFKSPTKYLGVYLNAQKYLKDKYPVMYDRHVPSCMKFPVVEDFDELLYHEQISVSKGLNMVYTFRVGDVYISNMLDNSIIDKECFKKVLSSLELTPNKDEANRVYRLYVGLNNLYNV